MEDSTGVYSQIDESDWKRKCEECENRFVNLKSLAAKGVKAYDDLLAKFNENQEQYKFLAERLRTREEQLFHMRTLFEPVYNEFDELQTKYKIEATCRTEVEKYASKLTKENKVLRRQSQAFLNKTGGLVPVEMEPDSYKEHTDQINLKIKELETEMTSLKQKLRETEEIASTQKERAEKATMRLQKTKKELEQSKKAVKQHEQALKELADFSEIAYDEYQHLKKKHSLEAECRSRAEQYASKMHSQTEAIKRQSNILLMSVASDEKLLKALTEVEEANEKFEELKQSHEVQVNELQTQLDETRKGDQVPSLEEELSKLEADNENLRSKLDDFNSQYTVLESKYKELEDKYENVIRPPPPPPPPIPAQFSKTRKNVIDIIKDKKKTRGTKLTKAGVTEKDGYAKAIEEMMSRIKGGQPILKSRQTLLRRPSCPDETDSGNAMEELHNIFSKMKRTRSEGDLISSVDNDSGGEKFGSELAKTFMKIRGSPVSNPQTANSGGPQALTGLPSLAEERESQIS